MCFSAEASLATGLALVPAGAYFISTAWRKNAAYLPVAATPLLFGVQQLCEAGVWRGLEDEDPAQVKVASLAFLFFAIAFWPGWVPLATAVLESRREKRRLLFAGAALGLVLGCACYLPAAFHYEDWLVVAIVGHSIQYDLSREPAAHTVASEVWQGLYLGLVCCPFLLSRDMKLRILGISIAVSAVITQLMFRYAFASVWCFFAAWLSLHIGYVLYRLPAPRRA